MPWNQPQIGGATQELLRGTRAGMLDLFVAPRFTAHTAPIGQIGGWEYCGVVKAGSPKNDFSRDFYDLATGGPETVKDSWVIKVAGSLEVTLIEPSAKIMALAAGHGQRKALFDTTPLTTTVEATGSTLKTIAVEDESEFEEGDDVEVTVGTQKQYSVVIGIEAGKLHLYPILSAIPATGASVKRVDGWEVAQGTSRVEKVAAMTVFTDNRTGRQLVTWIRDARTGGVKEDVKDGKSEMEFPVSFQAFGYKDPEYDGPITAKKFDLSKRLALPFDVPTT